MYIDGEESIHASLLLSRCPKSRQSLHQTKVLIAVGSRVTVHPSATRPNTGFRILIRALVSLLERATSKTWLVRSVDGLPGRQSMTTIANVWRYCHLRLWFLFSMNRMHQNSHPRNKKTFSTMTEIPLLIRSSLRYCTGLNLSSRAQ